MLCHTICIYDFVHLVNVRSCAHSLKHTRIYLKLHNYFAVQEVGKRKKIALLSLWTKQTKKNKLFICSYFLNCIILFISCYIFIYFSAIARVASPPLQIITRLQNPPHFFYSIREKGNFNATLRTTSFFSTFFSFFSRMIFLYLGTACFPGAATLFLP